METIQIRNILAYLDELGVLYQFEGDSQATVTGFSSLTQYKDASFTWVKTQKNADAAAVTLPIRLAFLQTDVALDAENKIISANSKHAFFSTMEHFYGAHDKKPPIGSGTYLSPRVKLGKNVNIGCNCTLDGDITIGDGTIIENNVVLQNRVTIGENCTIQSGCCIGIAGFGYTEDENHVKTMVKHFGGVVIGSDVFVGAHVNIARATIDNTVIGNDVKIAPSTHIGHNVQVGDHATIICSTVYGTVHLEKNSYISAAIVRNQCTVGENAMVGMGAVVTKDVAANTLVLGNPAHERQMTVQKEGK